METKPNDKANHGLRTDRMIDGLGVLTEFSSGLTNREYFAAMAMQGLLGNHNAAKDIAKSGKTIPEIAVQAADSLIIELKATTQHKGDEK